MSLKGCLDALLVPVVALSQTILDSRFPNILTISEHTQVVLQSSNLTRCYEKKCSVMSEVSVSM
jgi:hypothetical protein